MMTMSKGEAMKMMFSKPVPVPIPPEDRVRAAENGSRGLGVEPERFIHMLNCFAENGWSRCGRVYLFEDLPHLFDYPSQAESFTPSKEVSEIFRACFFPPSLYDGFELTE